MPRVAIPVVVLDADGVPKAGASVTVKHRSDNTNATIYAGESGGTTTANPMSTDAIGRVTGWLERDAYNLIVTGSGITGFTEPFDAAPASDGAVAGAWVSTEVLPVGSVVPYAGASDPTGGQWLKCDGRAISRTTYADLFAEIGTTFGSGDGSSTFNIPDLTGRSVLGVGTPNANTGGAAVPGATAHTRGTKAGSEKHTLAAAESGLPAHGHTASQAEHNHTISAVGEGATEYPAQGAAGVRGSQFSGAGGSDDSIAFTSSGSFSWALRNAPATPAVTVNNASAAAAASAHENLPQHLVLNHIIRVI